MDKFYKLAKTNGWDWFTGNNINYRNNIGKTVVCPKFNKNGKLCSNAFIHASREPNQCFVGAKIPCSAYLVTGKPIKEDKEKCGFQKLEILEELDPKKLFIWRYEEACKPLHPFKIAPPKISPEILNLLRKWASVWASVSVGDSVWDSVWASVSVGDSVWDSVWASVGDSVKDSVGESVWDSVWESVWASVWAYIGYLFSSCIKKWKYIDHKDGEYPFQPIVDLWKMGLVSNFNGKLWRLHGGKKGKILWEGILDNKPFC